MQKLFLSDVNSPQVELEYGGKIKQINSLTNATKNCNFDEWLFKEQNVVSSSNIILQ